MVQTETKLLLFQKFFYKQKRCNISTNKKLMENTNGNNQRTSQSSQQLSKKSYWQKFKTRAFDNPNQVSRKHYKIVSICGKIGFFTKGFIYGTVGALTCKSAFTTFIENESPQGVFILLESTPTGASEFLLICMLLGVIVYAIWRYWEGLTGQGYDPTYSNKKNFLKFRLIPLGSAIVYTLYGIYVIQLVSDSDEKDEKEIKDGLDGSTTSRVEDETCFPLCWRETTIKKIGLGLLAVAFTLATLSQLLPAFTGNFYREMDKTRLGKGFGRIVKYPFYFAGHVGYFARAILFFLVCLLFWTVLLGVAPKLDPTHATVGQAINSTLQYFWGKAILAILGIGLLFFGIFSVLCSFYKIFPTIPPSANAHVDGNSMSHNV